jgi:lysophospholipase L1-like esterase
MVVVSFGNNDIAEFSDGQARVSFLETVENCTNVIGESARWRPTYWVGPLPVNEERMPFYSSVLQRDLFFRNAKVTELNATFADIATNLKVPYLDLFSVLSDDPNYKEAIATLDGLHPNGDGYELVARMIVTWRPWRSAIDGARGAAV